MRHPSEYTDRSAPYAGPGPHPADFFQLEDGSQTDVIRASPSNDRLPAEWRPTGDNASTNVQLVICEYRTRTGSAIKSCGYNQPPYFDPSTAAPVIEGRRVTMSLVEASYTGEAGLASKGPSGSGCRLSDAQLDVLAAALD